MGRRLKTYDIGTDLGTIPTAAGNTDKYLIVPKSGKIVAAYFSGTSALAVSDTNYVTFIITNLGQAGAGSAAPLATSPVNTSKATGGAPVAAHTKYALTLSGTVSDLAVTEGDRLRIRVTGTGTLANTIPDGRLDILIDANGQ